MLKSMKLILHSKSEYVKGTCHIYEVIDITQCLSIIHQCLLHPPPPLVGNFLHSNFISVQNETLNFRIQSLENVIKYI